MDVIERLAVDLLYVSKCEASQLAPPDMQRVSTISEVEESLRVPPRHMIEPVARLSNDGKRAEAHVIRSEEPHDTNLWFCGIRTDSKEGDGIDSHTAIHRPPNGVTLF
jgi:hypothetical protein